MVSGTFKRGMKLTPSGLGKPIAVHSPILFFAQDREIADSAEAGDIIGIPTTARCAWAIRCRKRTTCALPAAQLLRPKSCARGAERPDQDQAIAQGARRSCRRA
jgi:translation elongation factor EF-G